MTHLDETLKEAGHTPVELSKPLNEAFVDIRVAQLLKEHNLPESVYGLVFEVGRELYKSGIIDGKKPIEQIF